MSRYFYYMSDWIDNVPDRTADREYYTINDIKRCPIYEMSPEQEDTWIHCVEDEDRDPTETEYMWIDAVCCVRDPDRYYSWISGLFENKDEAYKALLQTHNDDLYEYYHDL